MNKKCKGELIRRSISFQVVPDLRIDPEQTLERPGGVQEEGAVVGRVGRDQIVGLLHQHAVSPQLRHLPSGKKNGQLTD